MPSILVVEDDENLGRGLEINLKKEGYSVLRARRGETAIPLAAREQPDLITLDVMLPGMSGLDVCRELRRRGIRAPIIMLTARAEEIDKVLGFEIGADDYVTKPFGIRELVARIRARLRRDAATSGTDAAVLRAGAVEVDLERFTVTRDGRALDLTAREFDILRLLIRHRGDVVTRAQLIDEVWGGDADLNARTVDTHVMNLRRKIEEDPGNPRVILSVYGEGYRLVG
jgi:DNA-binding response OmpR family regulator